MQLKSRTKTILYFNGLLALFIILWGAWVLLSGSGAGCGDHWPLCNGEILPLNPSYKTFIEFTHRLSSGIFGITVFLQLLFAKWDYPKGHQIFKGSLAFLILTIVEALIGAVLVKKGLVVDDSSVMRAWVIGAHLVNTLLLMGAWGYCQRVVSKASPFKYQVMTTKQKLAAVWGISLFLLVGAFGAITALGNTLFPSSSLSEGLASDFSSSAPFLIQLRVYHPILAITLGLTWFLISNLYVKETEVGDQAGWPQGLQALVFISLGFGVLNYLLMAPVWAALVHLALADIFWLVAVGHLCRIHYKSE
jgi:cytochrome c oxidase assembly protein subunit 15